MASTASLLMRIGCCSKRNLVHGFSYFYSGMWEHTSTASAATSSETASKSSTKTTSKATTKAAAETAASKSASTESSTTESTAAESAAAESTTTESATAKSATAKTSTAKTAPTTGSESTASAVDPLNLSYVNRGLLWSGNALRETDPRPRNLCGDHDGLYKGDAIASGDKALFVLDGQGRSVYMGSVAGYGPGSRASPTATTSTADGNDDGLAGTATSTTSKSTAPVSTTAKASASETTEEAGSSEATSEATAAAVASAASASTDVACHR